MPFLSVLFVMPFLSVLFVMPSLQLLFTCVMMHSYMYMYNVKFGLVCSYSVSSYSIAGKLP